MCYCTMIATMIRRWLHAIARMMMAVKRVAIGVYCIVVLVDAGSATAQYMTSSLRLAQILPFFLCQILPYWVGLYGNKTMALPFTIRNEKHIICWQGFPANMLRQQSKKNMVDMHAFQKNERAFSCHQQPSLFFCYGDSRLETRLCSPSLNLKTLISKWIRTRPSYTGEIKDNATEKERRQIQTKKED